MPNEQLPGRSPEAEKEEEAVEQKDAGKESDKSGFIFRMARKILRATGRVGYPEEVPNAGNGSREQNQEPKKEASGALLGCKLGLLGLGGIIALALGGTIIGLQKLNSMSKAFMNGYNLGFSGGTKGGGGKKEKG